MAKRTRMSGFIILMFFYLTHMVYAEADNPCLGANAFMNIIDRPNNADSACTVPFKHFEFESGYAYQRVVQALGEAHDFPEPELRIGLPWQSEIYLIPPNYNYLPSSHLTGFTDAVIGLKHQVGYNAKWIFTVEGALSLPGGSSNFGNRALGSFANAIINYNITDTLSLTFMLGGSTETDPDASGGRRYNSFNPDGVLSYALTEKISMYAEIFGQTKTSAEDSSGFNADAGLLYLLHPNIILDVSVGQRLWGYLGGYENYIGSGISFLI
ncbi:transporter [Legionella beliardensis]|nr:transporter [Legionella beliardensis]